MAKARWPGWRDAGVGAITLACALALPGVAAAADAAPSSNHIGGVRFDVHGDVGGYASIGAGFRVDVPVLRSGVFAQLDDELALSAGLEVFFTNFYRAYYDGGPYLVPNAVVQWNFYLGSDWSVFPEAGVAFYIGDADELPRALPVYATVALGLGARYHFSARNALLVRLSTPTGLQIGVTF